MRLELTDRQAEVISAALRMWIEDRGASLREGTYSAINAERVKVALEVLGLLNARWQTVAR